MAEKDLWATMRKYVSRYGHFYRIENLTGRGTPDVTYCVARVEGWIELKQLPAWPKREDTVVDVPHYTPHQRLWARQRLSAGGRVYVLLEVVRPVPTYLLLGGEYARLHLAVDATQAALRRAALVTGVGAFPTNPLLHELTRPDPRF